MLYLTAAFFLSRGEVIVKAGTEETIIYADIGKSVRKCIVIQWIEVPPLPWAQCIDFNVQLLFVIVNFLYDMGISNILTKLLQTQARFGPFLF